MMATPAHTLKGQGELWRRGTPAVPPGVDGWDWPWIFEVTKNAFDRAQYFHFPDSDRRIRATLGLMNLMLAVREYAIITAEDIRPIWAQLRSDTGLLDFLLNVTADLYLETGLTVHDVAAAVAKAIHCAIPRNAAGEVVMVDTVYDAPFAESVGTVKELVGILDLHPWLLTLLILKRSGRLNLVRPQTQPPATE